MSSRTSGLCRSKEGLTLWTQDRVGLGRELCEEVCRSQCPESSPEVQHLVLPDANVQGELDSSFCDTKLRDEAAS